MGNRFFVPEGVCRPNWDDLGDARTKYYQYVFDRFATTSAESQNSDDDMLYDISFPGVWLHAKTKDGTKLCTIYLGPAPHSLKKKELWLEYGTDMYDICVNLQTSELDDCVVFIFVVSEEKTIAAKHAFGLDQLTSYVESATEKVSVYVHVATRSDETELFLGTVSYARSQHEKSIVRTQSILDKLKPVLAAVAQEIADVKQVHYTFSAINELTGSVTRFAAHLHSDLYWEVSKLQQDDGKKEIRNTEPEEVSLIVQIYLRHRRIKLWSKERSITILNRLDYRELVRIFKDEIVALVAQVPNDPADKSAYEIQILGYPKDPTILLKPKTLQLWLAN